MTEAEKVISRWNACAKELMGEYTDEGDFARTVLLNPTLWELLEDVTGKKS